MGFDKYYDKNLINQATMNLDEFIEKLKELIKKRNPNCLIEVDGGVSDKNIKDLKDAGVNIVVAGSFVFGSSDYKKAIDSLKV